MGHSAGAHLVSLVNADASIRRVNAVQPLLGVVSLDAGAIDVVRQMPNVYPFLEVRYREAFGDTESAFGNSRILRVDRLRHVVIEGDIQTIALAGQLGAQQAVQRVFAERTVDRGFFRGGGNVFCRG